MKKVNVLFVLTLLIYLYCIPGHAQSDCTSRSLFSMMPNHEEASCEIKEFDSHIFYKSKNDGSYETLEKRGEKTIATYNWLGDWDKRPSKTQIYGNYQSAIEKQGGELLYSGSYNHFKLRRSSDNYFIEVSTDGSGIYSITTVKENTMKQDVVFTAEEIDRSVTQEGQITFYGIYFDINKATLKPESSSSLKEIASYLKSNIDKQVYLVGHTDNSGTHEYNLKLSKERSQTVVNELINQYGVSATQLSAQGVGDLCPIANNLTPEGKAKTGVW